MLRFDKDLQGEAKRTERNRNRCRCGIRGRRANERENGGVRKRVKVSRDNCPDFNASRDAK